MTLILFVLTSQNKTIKEVNSERVVQFIWRRSRFLREIEKKQELMNSINIVWSIWIIEIT